MCVIRFKRKEYRVRIRRREIAVNVLLGLLRILIFAAPVVVAAVALGFLLPAVDSALKIYFPFLSRHWESEFYGFVCLWSFWSGVTHFRKRRWPNAFVCFGIIPMIDDVDRRTPLNYSARRFLRSVLAPDHFGPALFSFYAT